MTGINVHFQNLNCLHFLDGWDKICAEMYSSSSGNDPLYCLLVRKMQSKGKKKATTTRKIFQYRILINKIMEG